MKALIIANGIPPPRRFVRSLARSADLIVAADGGANLARKLHIKPDVILGDLDSILPSTKKFFKTVPLLFIEHQNSTDLEKAIEFCIRRGSRSIDIVGAIGDRIDHSSGSLGSFKKYGHRVDLKLFDSVATISMIQKEMHFRARPGEVLSLIPLDRCEGVTTKNLKYPLTNGRLELGVREGIHNEATSKPVSIRVKRGTLLLYRFYEPQCR